jgi:hypothetical protein
MEDQNNERTALLKEKDHLLKEHVALKAFLPEFEQMEQRGSNNKRKFLIEMKDRCSKEEFLNYLY